MYAKKKKKPRRLPEVVLEVVKRSNYFKIEKNNVYYEKYLTFIRQTLEGKQKKGQNYFKTGAKANLAKKYYHG